MVALTPTFGDESYQGTKERCIAVLAEVPTTADIRWFYDVASRLPGELKYSRLKRHLNSLGNDLQSAVRRGVSHAVIFITDPNIYYDPA